MMPGNSILNITLQKYRTVTPVCVLQRLVCVCVARTNSQKSIISFYCIKRRGGLEHVRICVCVDIVFAICTYQITAPWPRSNLDSELSARH